MLPARIVELLRDLDLPTDGDFNRFDSDSNEVWIGPTFVVRFHGLGPAGRLTHEARVAERLPFEARHARVVAAGWLGDDDWMVLERVDGTSLSVAWPTMSTDERTQAIVQFAGALRQVHGVDPDNLLPPCLFGGKPLIPRGELAEATLAYLHSAEGDAAVLSRARSIVEEYGGYIDDPPSALIHGDLNFNNVLWDGAVTALLDFEWARPEARDVDLLSFISFCQHAKLCVPEEVAGVTEPEDYRDAPHWLREAYPELFAHPHVRERVVLYDVARWAQGLYRSTAGARHHAHDMLVDIVDGRGTADYFEWS